MPELWDQLAQQSVAEPPSLWPGGDRAPLRITVGGPTMKDGAQAPGYSLDPFNPPPVEYVGRPIAEKLASLFSGPSWLQRATEQSAKDQAVYQTGGVPALMADTAAGQELAGGFGGTTVGKLAPAFFSAAGRAVENAKLGKGTADQWLGYLRNQPGVKPEELQYVFGNLPEGQLTKAQMQAHAAENAVTLGEVEKGNTSSPRLKALDDEIRPLSQWPNDPLTARNPADQSRLDALLHEWDKENRLSKAPTKYEQWQLPGGENYRETLLTLPEKPRPATQAAQDFYQHFERRGGEPAWDSLSTEQQNAVINRMPQEAFAQPPRFTSSHWDEPNVLAHVRTNDREIPGVGKSLHVEEIQSDWHQKGRTQGYKSDLTKEHAEQMGYSVYKARSNLGTDSYFLNGPDNIRNIPMHGSATEGEAWDRLLSFIQKHDSSVPDAPFKSTWADVALKRQIREASEKGYDAISWTPGEAQAARYDLSKHVDKVNLIPHETIHQGGKVNYRVEAYKDNRKVIEHFAADEKGVADAVGKEVAEKLFSNRNQHGAATASGLDLKVGGEGMRAFYDKMLVDKANAIGKKHGARVEQQEVWPEGNLDNWPVDALTKDGAMPVHVLRITPELRAAAMKGFPLFSLGAGGAALAPGLFNNATPAPINMWDSNAPN